MHVLAKRLLTQAAGCEWMGSSFYATLFRRAADDVEAGGPVLDVLRGHEDDPGPSGLSLRLAGQVHRMVLAGTAPALAAHYPSVGGDGDAEAAWIAFRALVAERCEELRPLLERTVQTNEVGRSAALVVGYQAVAAATGLPLRCLEIGTSGGLNLRFDRYRYGSWGDPASPLVFDVSLPSDVAVVVAERRGCDAAPVDPTTEDGRLTLLSFLWPDQRARFGRTAAAIDVARRVPADVEQADAVEWLGRVLAEPAAGVATVVCHSVVRQYLTDARWEAVLEAVRPVWHLRMEPVVERGDRELGADHEVRLTSPEGEDRLLARCGGHGLPVSWVA